MSYLELLHLDREPFSNSPDPAVYCAIPQHEDCLNRLEIAIRLKRGLNVVIGMVGTGKSTLCRCLLRNISGQPGMEVSLMLDAGGTDRNLFFAQLYETITGQRLNSGLDLRVGIASLQEYVYERTQKQGKTLVLFIDEGQKLSRDALEILRELLNFETNTEKLLQIVIFAQPELEAVIDSMPNFKDRINEYYRLSELSARESAQLVRHRLRLAGGQQAEQLFMDSALTAMHKVSCGRPRQLVRLGHQMLLALIMNSGSRVTASMVRAQVAREGGKPPLSLAVKAGLGLAGCLVVVTGMWMTSSHWLPLVTSRMQAAQSSAGTSAGSPSVKLHSSGTSSVSGTVQSGGTADSKVQSTANAGDSKGNRVADDGVAKSGQSQVVHVDGTMSLEEIAQLFYGTSSMARELATLNPGYLKGKASALTLPLKSYVVPDSYCSNALLSFGRYDSADGALQARKALDSFAPRIVLREMDGQRMYYLLSRESFSTSARALSWLKKQTKLPEGVTAVVMPPYAPGSRAFYNFPER